jgi:hypothetical protein
MAVYRQIHISFWQDEFVLDLEPEEKYFYLYLMTNSKTTQCGIYILPKKLMMLELGYSIDTVSKLLARFIDMGKILYDDGTGTVFLLNWLKHNSMKSPKVQTCVKKELKAVRNKDFLEVFATQCVQYGYSIDTLDIQWGEELRTKNKELRTNKDIYTPVDEREDEPPAEPNEPIEPPKPSPKKTREEIYEEAFEMFYNLYPRKRDRKPAFKAFLAAVKKHDIQTIIDGVKAYAKECEVKKTPKDKIKYPATFLNGESWTNEFDFTTDGKRSLFAQGEESKKRQEEVYQPQFEDISDEDLPF